MQWAHDEIICWCSRVTAGTIRQAVAAGARDMTAIREITGACTIGRCKELNPSGK